MPRTSLRAAFPFLVAGLGTLAGVLPARRAEALSPYLVVPEASVAEATAAYRYANMTGSEALAELDKRKIPYKKADPLAGVVAPVRLTGKLHGVAIHSSIPESQRADSIYEVLDARLALALDDFAKILSRHDIEEVVHYSLYRPNVPREEHDLKEGRSEAKAATRSEAKAATGSTKAASGSDAKAATANNAKAAAGATGSGEPKGKAVAALAKGKQAPSKAGAAAHKPLSALPAPPAGKAFAAAPARDEPTAGRGAKQKTPAAAVKKATKSGPVKAASHRTSAPTGRGVRPHVARVANKGGAAAPARPRGATATKAPPKAAAKGARKVATKGSAALQTPAASRGKAAAPASAKAPAASAPAAPAHSHAPASRQKWASPGTRHPAGLAIDVAMLKKRDGQWVSVATHFRGRIGAKTCGDGVRTADTPEGRELRSIVCEANDLGVFTYVLTPNYNAAHFDHFHMEIRPQVKWFLYQ